MRSLDIAEEVSEASAMSPSPSFSPSPSPSPSPEARYVQRAKAAIARETNFVAKAWMAMKLVREAAGIVAFGLARKLSRMSRR